MPTHAIIPFEVLSFVEPTRVRVKVTGELDIATVPLLVEALRAVEREHDRTIVLDLGGLTFTDASGLHAIATASSRAQRRGRRLVVARPSEQILRLFELSGIEQSLELADVAEQPGPSGRARRRIRTSRPRIADSH
jgi:anti-sigma B factor antagonist